MPALRWAFPLLAAALAFPAVAHARPSGGGAAAQPPRPLRAVVHGAQLTLTWSAHLRRLIDPQDFLVTRNGSPLELLSARVAGRDVRLTLAEPAYADDLVDVSYIAVSVHGIRDRTGRPARPSVRLRAANRSAVGCTPYLAPETDDLGEGIYVPGTYIPSRGQLRLLVLPVAFADVGFRVGSDTIVGQIQQAFDHLELESVGQLHMGFTLAPGVAVLPHPASDYSATDFRIGFDAIAAADPTVDFGGYDAVVLYVNGGGARHSYAARDIWVPSREGPVRSYVALSSRDAWSHVLAHELAHLMGLPDLYDQYQATPELFSWVGSWDLMSDSEAGLLAWHRFKLGWIEPAAIRCLRRGRRELVLAPLGTLGLQALVVPFGPYHALVLENRRLPAERNCHDGLLAYRVDSRIESGEGPVKVWPAEVAPPSNCGWMPEAAFELGAGRRATTDYAGVRIEVLARDAGGALRVRVTQTLG